MRGMKGAWFQRIRGIRSGTFTLLGFLLLAPWCQGDDTIYHYEGNVHLLDPSTDWVLANPCESPCSESIENGHFVLRWQGVGEFVNYHHFISLPDEPPPRRCGLNGGFARTIRWG